MTTSDQLLSILLIDTKRFPLALHIGRIGATNVRTFIPLQPQPAQPIHNRTQRFRLEARLVGILNAQNKLTARMARQQIIKQGRTQPTQM